MRTNPLGIDAGEVETRVRKKFPSGYRIELTGMDCLLWQDLPTFLAPHYLSRTTQIFSGGSSGARYQILVGASDMPLLLKGLKKMGGDLAMALRANILNDLSSVVTSSEEKDDTPNPTL